MACAASVIDPLLSPGRAAHASARAGGDSVTPPARGGSSRVKQRDVALRKAHSKMTLLKAYVQTVANAEPDKAQAILLSAGMNAGKPRTWTKPPIEAKRGDAPG